MDNGNKEPGWCELLYRAKAADLLLYGRALGLGHGEAEDVLQETFLAFLQRPDPPSRADYYCLRAFRNRALNYRRSLWRRLSREWESLRWFERSAGESQAERKAMLALATLPQPQREVIVLKIWHHYTFEEIGELIEVSPSTAAGRYRYGVEKLRSILKGVDYERDEPVGDAFALLETPPPLGRA
jgi:RNA polymerase sigma-70 factor (ECF subfamily)